MASAFPASQTYASKFSAVLCPKCNLMVWFPGLYGLLVEKFPDKMTHSSGHEWPHSVWLKLGKRGDSPWLVSPSSWAQQSTICEFPPSRGYLGHNQGGITFCWLFSNSASYHRSVCSSALNPRDQTFTWVMNFGWVRGLPLVLAGLSMLSPRYGFFQSTRVHCEPAIVQARGATCLTSRHPQIHKPCSVAAPSSLLLAQTNWVKHRFHYLELSGICHNYCSQTHLAFVDVDAFPFCSVLLRNRNSCLWSAFAIEWNPALVLRSLVTLPNE